MKIEEVFDDRIVGTMPVDERTMQPFRILHGGASAVLAESLASIASMLVSGVDFVPLGLSITVNHLNAAPFGTIVTGTAKAKRIGKTHFVWEVEIVGDSGALVSTSLVTIVTKPARKTECNL